MLITISLTQSNISKEESEASNLDPLLLVYVIDIVIVIARGCGSCSESGGEALVLFLGSYYTNAYVIWFEVFVKVFTHVHLYHTASVFGMS